MPEPSRTMFAQQAMDLAQLFKMTVGSQPVPGRTIYNVELAAPEGPSTGGGVQGVQHITLVPHGGDGASIVAGLANKANQTAELRTHAYLRQQHKRRSNAELPLDLKGYDELLDRMTQFFSSQGLTVRRVDAAPEPAQLAAPPQAKPFPWVAVAAVGALAVAAAIFLFLRGS